MIAKGAAELPVALRLARDPEGRELLLTSEEALYAASLVKDEALREKDEAVRGKDEALREKDEALLARDEATAEVLRENERLRKLLADRGG